MEKHFGEWTVRVHDCCRDEYTGTRPIAIEIIVPEKFLTIAAVQRICQYDWHSCWDGNVVFGWDYDHMWTPAKYKAGYTDEIEKDILDAINAIKNLEVTG